MIGFGDSRNHDAAKQGQEDHRLEELVRLCFSGI